MITAHANSGIDALHSVLTSADAQLENISNRLLSEFSLNHPETQTNPFALLQRLRSLNNAIPALREQLLAIHLQKAKLVTRCTTDLAETTRLARCVLPLAIPASTDPNSLDDQLTQSESSLARLLAEFTKVNTDFVHHSHLAEQHLNFDLLRAAADINPPAPQPHTNIVENTPVQNPVMTKTVPQKTKPKNQVTVQENKPKAQFVPVSKVVYNRLPRNLKIKAGKLPQINEFYEKVFNVLCHASSPLSDADLRNATGEHDMTKFDVLRGLAVLRHTKRGWMLAT